MGALQRPDLCSEGAAAAPSGGLAGVRDAEVRPRAARRDRASAPALLEGATETAETLGEGARQRCAATHGRRSSRRAPDAEQTANDEVAREGGLSAGERES